MLSLQEWISTQEDNRELPRKEDMLGAGSYWKSEWLCGILSKHESMQEMHQALEIGCCWVFSQC